MHLQYAPVKSLISFQMVSSAVYRPFPEANPVPLYLLPFVINKFKINIHFSWLLLRTEWRDDRPASLANVDFLSRSNTTI